MNKVINIKSMARIILVLSLILYPLLAWSQDPWSIRTDQPLQGDYYGITSANGQIGLVSSRHPLQVDKVVVGGLYDIYGSGRVNNFFPNINPLDILIQVNGTAMQPDHRSSEAYALWLSLRYTSRCAHGYRPQGHQPPSCAGQPA